MKQWIKGSAALVALGLLAITDAQAAGFEQPNHAATAAGVANAVAATADDPSALIYNPAGIAWQHGLSIAFSGYTDYRNSSVKIPAGIAPNRGNNATSESLFVSWSPRSSRWSAGFGLSPLYQLDNDWRVAFPGSAGTAKITVDHLTLDSVYAYNSDLAVGAGLDWYVTRAQMQQNGNNFSGRDMGGFGLHLSTLWKVRPAWSLAAVYRSGASVSIHQGSAQMAFKLPDHLTLAVAHDLNDHWRLEGDLKYSRWSLLKQLNVTQAGAVVQNNPLNLHDAITLMTGLTWTWRENAQIRFGYAFEQGANRSAGFSPIVADQDGHRLSLGAGGQIGVVHLDLAYQYVFYAQKSATGAFAGTYRDRRQSLLFTLSTHID